MSGNRINLRNFSPDGKSRFLCSRLNFVDMSGVDHQSPCLQSVSGSQANLVSSVNGRPSNTQSSPDIVPGSETGPGNAQDGVVFGEENGTEEVMFDEVEVDPAAALLNTTSDVTMPPDHQCLANVIASLVDRNHSGAVPYAHSMLTQLLKVKIKC